MPICRSTSAAKKLWIRGSGRWTGCLRQEAKELIARELDKMDDFYRAILVLRDIEQLDYATIADVLDIQVGTVRSRLHRARLRLRELLAKAR